MHTFNIMIPIEYNKQYMSICNASPLLYVDMLQGVQNKFVFRSKNDYLIIPATVTLYVGNTFLTVVLDN